MTARPSDADRRSSAPGDANTPAPARGDSIPVTSPPLPDMPPTAPHPASLVGVPAELRDHPIYEVQKELGRGGMGVVYLARQKLIGRLEVLKVLQDRLAGRPDLLARFTNEVQMAGRLNHPNIVIAYGAFPAGNALVLAMEYVEGRTLAEVVQRKGPLSVVHACAFARQIALGLQRAHEEGMVHRDIKPQNVMLSRRGEVKVLDFGLAKVASEEAETGMTGTGAMMGTPDYMPPEQALDAKSADIRADVYSLGCTLYFLLTGRPPFTGRSPYEVMHSHQTQPPPALPGAPAELEALVARMLAKRPEDRPQTPGDVARALAAFTTRGESRAERPTASMPPPLPPPPPPPRPAMRSGSTLPIPQPAPRHRGGAARLLLGVGTATLALLALLASLWAGGVFSGLARGPEGHGAQGSDQGNGNERPREITSSIGMKLVLIPAGKFKMGSPGDEQYHGTNEQQHEVELTEPFYMGVYEVTQKQFKDVMGYNPSYFSKDGNGKAGAMYFDNLSPAGGKGSVAGIDTSDFPVENVSWDEAVEFCKRLTERDRKAGKIGREQEYRLPTEAEWEYSCRGGAASSQSYHFGDQLSTKDANIRVIGAGPPLQHVLRPENVGSYKPNAFGLHDMHGNVWEWCQDWYAEDYYASSPKTNPVGPQTGSERVYRGGSFCSEFIMCRTAIRLRGEPKYGYLSVGFRVSLSSSGGKE